METRSRVVIIDNDPDALHSLRAAFAAGGFETALASDGSTAVRAIATQRPDVVVLDVAMPALDGWFVLAQLAGIPGAPPVIVTADRSHPLDEARAHALGACRYLVKPSDPDVVVGAARRASEQFAVVA